MSLPLPATTPFATPFSSAFASSFASSSSSPSCTPAPDLVLVAAVQLLAERGWHGLTLDDVAARAGLAPGRLRATWPSLSTLVGAAVATVPVLQDRGDTGTAVGDLGRVLEHWARPLGRGELAVAAVAEAAGLDPELRAGVEVAVTDAVCEVMCAIAARARLRGEPIGAARQQWTTAVLGGAVWERITGRGRPVEAGRRAELVDSILACA